MLCCGPWLCVTAGSRRKKAIGTIATTTAHVQATVTGSSGADVLTLGAAQTGVFDLASGADVLTLANGTNLITASNVESVSGGTGISTVGLANQTGGLITPLEARLYNPIGSIGVVASPAVV